MTQARQALGRQGEALACDALVTRGYAIVAQRYRTRAGELDIVARHGAYVVFVEVKARQGGGCGNPEEAVTAQKQRRLAWMATDFLSRHGLDDAPCRFDVVTVDASAEPPVVTILEDAFRPGW